MKIKYIVHSFINRQLFSDMTSVEEVEQLDSGMGSSDAHSPEVKSLLPDDEDDEEVLDFDIQWLRINVINKWNFALLRVVIFTDSNHN